MPHPHGHPGPHHAGPHHRRPAHSHDYHPHGHHRAIFQPIIVNPVNPGPRPIFSDGVNSAAHVAIGAVAVRTNFLLVGGIFLAYELMQEDQENTMVDIAEFAVGAAASAALLQSQAQ